jgi:O-antigen/teichoic acid export membrane protein
MGLSESASQTEGQLRPYVFCPRRTPPNQAEKMTTKGRHYIALLGSTMRVASFAITTIVGFFLMPFIIHRLGDHDYGYWALVGAVIGYFGVLDLGIVTAVQYQVAKALGDEKPESGSRAISTAFYAFAVLGLVSLLLTAIVAQLSKRIIPHPSDALVFRHLLYIVGLGFAVGFPGRAFIGAMSAHMRYDIGSSISICILFLRTVFIVLIIGSGGGVISLAIITVLSDAVSYILNYAFLRKIHHNLQISPRLASLNTLKELFHYSGYALVIQISDLLRFTVDGWMVAVFVSVSAVTHYSVAGRLAQAFMSLIIAGIGILSPWFSQLMGSSDFEGIRRIFVTGTKISVVASTIVACSLILYGRVFITKWVGPQYDDAYWPLVLLVVAIFCDVSQLPSVSYMLGVARHRFLAIVTVGEGIANFCLSVLWARHYGMVGVALGTLVPMVIAKLLIQPVYVCRQMETSVLEYFKNLLGRAFATPILTCLLLWFVVFRNIEPRNVAATCGIIILQGVVCALVSCFIVFGQTDRAFILGKLPFLRRSQRADAI